MSENGDRPNLPDLRTAAYRRADARAGRQKENGQRKKQRRAQRWGRGLPALLIVLLTAVATVVEADVTGWVKDASKAAFPFGAARGRVSGVPFIITRAQVMIYSTGSVTRTGKRFNRADLDLQTAANAPAAVTAHVSVQVPQGEELDGRTFVRLPHAPTPLNDPHKYDDYTPAELIPDFLPGTLAPTVGSLSLMLTANGDLKNTLWMRDINDGAAPTLRLKFGKRRGNVLPGKIYLCWNDQAKSFVAGTFEATIR